MSSVSNLNNVWQNRRYFLLPFLPRRLGLSSFHFSIWTRTDKKSIWIQVKNISWRFIDFFLKKNFKLVFLWFLCWNLMKLDKPCWEIFFDNPSFFISEDLCFESKRIFVVEVYVNILTLESRFQIHGSGSRKPKCCRSLALISSMLFFLILCNKPWDCVRIL